MIPRNAQAAAMRSLAARLLIVAIAPATLATALAQSPKIEFPAASPACTIKQRIGITDVTVVYSRPSARGRHMLGGIDPYGQVWRTGANDATRITFSGPVKLNGTAVEAGAYGLFTVPGESDWTVILSKDAKQWGAYKYDPKDDVVRIKATAAVLPEPVETLTIDFGNFSVGKAELQLSWEKTRVPVLIESDLSPVVAQIYAALAAPGGKKPYLPAAQFYFYAGLDPVKALGWVDAAIQQQPPMAQSFGVATLRAGLLARAGRKDEAVAQAHKAIELTKSAEEPARSEYVRLNQNTLAKLGAE